ncbi:MAG: dihydroneopterin aldolase [Bacteroidia bacterium]
MKIRVNGIKMYAFHGVFEEERKKGTHFVVDLCAHVNALPQNDALSHTIDYQTMYSIAVETLQTPVDLLETLAQTIGHRILEALPGVDCIDVQVHKEKPLHMPLCAETSVEINLSR